MSIPKLNDPITHRPSDASGWMVLTRPECSLCETMLLDLCELLGERAAAVRVLDISGDDELERKYGQRLPVLLIDGEFVCAYRVDQDRVRAYVGGND